MTASALEGLTRLYLLHYYEGGAMPRLSLADLNELHKAKVIARRATGASITWDGVLLVEAMAGELELVRRVVTRRRSIVQEALRLAAQTYDGRFSLREVQAKLGLSEHELTAHLTSFEHRLFTGYRLTIGFLQVTAYGQRFAA